MQSSTLYRLLGHLRKLTDPTSAADLSDADLLERFRGRREEAAFTLLVQRHGPMVYGICRRVLGEAHGAEDAFQATFLVLVRNAGSIRKRQSLASWLHGVALRIAHKARAKSARQRERERQVLPSAADTDPSEALAARELRAALDEEIARLPDKYRTPLVLCYLAEQTHEQAAAELGWPKSSVTARLARARQLLQQRLTRRGFTVPAGMLAVLLMEPAANAAVPALLTLSAVRLAVQALRGESLAAAAAATLADSVAKGAALVKWTAALTLLATFGLAAAVGHRLVAVSRQPKQPEPAPSAPAAANRGEVKAEVRTPRVDRFGDPLPPGARARLGTVRLRHGGEIGQFAFAPDGKVLAAASDDDRVCLWEVPTGRELRSLENVTAGIDPGVAFSADGKILATGFGDELRRWDTSTWKELPRWPLKSGRAGKLFFSPDGRVLACLGRTRRDNQTSVNTVVFLDTSTGQEMHHLDGRKNYRAPSIAFAPDSKTWAYVDCHDKTIALYDVRTGKELRRFEGHSSRAWTVAFSPDGRTLASTDNNGKLRFWNTATGEQLPRRGSFHVSNLTFFPDGKRLLGWYGVPLRYDIAAGKEIPTPGPRWSGEGPVLLSPDGTRLAWANEQHVLHLWDASTFQPVRPVTAHEREVDAVAFSPDSRVVVSAAGDNDFVRRWDAAMGQTLPPFRDVGDDVYALAYSPDGQMLAVGTGGHGGAIRLLEAATGKRLPSLVVPQDRLIVVSLAFSADGRRLLSVQGKNARLWDVATGKVLHTYQGDVFPDGPRILALSPDGQVIADGGGFDAPHTIHLRQAVTEKEVRALQDDAHVTALAFRPDGKTLASGGRDQTVKLWDVADGKLLWRTKGRRSDGGVYFLTFSPDGKTLASDDGEGGVYLWETATGKERGHFGKHRYGVQSGAFSRDGKLLATGSRDTTVLVWDVAAAAGTLPRSPLSARELDVLWTDLAGGDAAKAFRAIHRLAAAPEQTLPFLREHLKPVPAADPKRVRQLVEALDSADFSTRQKAAEELEKQADAAASLLRRIVTKEKPSLEIRRRLQRIVEAMENKPESLRAIRAVEVLEWIATPDTVKLLDELAKGAAERAGPERLSLHAHAYVSPRRAAERDSPRSAWLRLTTVSAPLPDMPVPAPSVPAHGST